jgi:hypothetical protein
MYVAVFYACWSLVDGVVVYCGLYGGDIDETTDHEWQRIFPRQL